MTRAGSIFLLLAAALTAQSAPPPRGEWRCVALTPRHLALTGDYTALREKLFREKLEAMTRSRRGALPKWAVESRFNLAGTEAIAALRPRAARLLRDAPRITIASDRGKIAVAGTGYWLSPVGQARFRDADGVEKFSLNADVAHYLFLTLDRPLNDGEKITLTLPAGETVDFTYRTAAPTPLFKLNQIGYMPEARKFAYLGAWLGTAGGLPLHREFGGREFRLVSDADGRTLLSGLLRPRYHDQVTKNGTPFTGCEVLEIDLTPCRTAGLCHLVVDGIGRSESFLIGDRSMAEAFYIHARGLFHQRCGIAKDARHTRWTMPACHQTSVRGTFPPEVAHYAKGNDHRSWGFRSAAGKSLKVDRFKLIAQNIPARPEILRCPGGWHDAADWDRRPQHLEIVGDLAAVYLLRPNNFSDGQLDLPESGNGVPDVLDEARWGIDHLRRKQQPDGGVGTWEETTRHPNFRDGGSAADQLTYYLSCATRAGTLEHAAYAAELALALKQAGDHRGAGDFHRSAAKAWDFAVDPKNRVIRTYRYEGQTIFYREPEEPDPVFLLKAAFDLYQLGGEERYLRAAEDAAPAALRELNKSNWRRSPLLWMELELFPSPSHELNKLKRKWRQMIVRQAKVLIRQQEENYPIRVPWYGVSEGWSHTMSWGTFHPLRRARLLVAAHALTGDREFLDGACLANDFHNGANPFGSTMTSGLGRVYPVRFLDLNSYADGIPEAIPGITPYRNTYGIPRDAVRMAYGLFYRSDRNWKFPGLALSLLPREGLNEDQCARELGRILPIWRRWGNVESRTVDASEFTVWETIAPAAVVTGYLLNGADRPDPAWRERQPAAEIRELPGYAPLP